MTDHDPGNPVGAATTPRRYAVVGTGAVGGYYGARLAHAGHEVHFLARSDAEVLRRDGLRVESPDGDFSLPTPSVCTSPDELPPVDCVLVTVKTTAQEEAAAMVGPLGSPTTALVAMQNGLGVEAALAARAPAGTPVLGAMCFLCSNRVAPGHIRHVDYGRVTVGAWTPDESPGGITPEVVALAADLEGAGVPSVPIADLAEGRWRKLVWNIPYNGLSVVLDAATNELMGAAPTRMLVRGLMEEVVAGAAACGHPIDDGFVEVMLDTTDRMAPYATSMKLDHDHGRPMELDTIYGAPLAAARAAGAPMVRAEMLLAQLRFLDAR